MAPLVWPSKVPCTVLTGFLGSGKTTLLNHIVKSQHHKRIAVIENEVGEVGINDMPLHDNHFFRVEEEVLEATCGCMCRTVRGDLIRCLKLLKKRCLIDSKPLDHIIIETSGLADPAAVVQTFFR
jgi:G3E family GTPase